MHYAQSKMRRTPHQLRWQRKREHSQNTPPLILMVHSSIRSGGMLRRPLQSTELETVTLPVSLRQEPSPYAWTTSPQVSNQSSPPVENAWSRCHQAQLHSIRKTMDPTYLEFHLRLLRRLLQQSMWLFSLRRRNMSTPPFLRLAMFLQQCLGKIS